MPTLTPEEGALEARIRELQERDHLAYEHLRRNARAVYRAVEGWSGVKSPDEWEKVCSESNTAYRSGHFLIERLGAERFLDPALMATLWGLRQNLLSELGKATAAEMMLVDMAMLAYYNALRVQCWIGNMALLVEHEFFGQASPTAKFGQQHGRFEGLALEDRLKKLGEELLPLLDRANKMMIRNLKAMRELRRGPAPTVAINRAEQVNVAEQQANTVIR